MVAIESLTGIADELKAAKGALLSALSGPVAVANPAAAAPSSPAAAAGPSQAATASNGSSGGLARDVDAYYARTVDAVQDLKEAIFKGATKQLLQVGASLSSSVNQAPCNSSSTHHW